MSDPAPNLLGIDHVLLAMPIGGEGDARAFYQDLLGIPEIAKPEALAGRGGCWFQNGVVQIHLGVEADFVPARKAHPAFLVSDLRALATKLTTAGRQLTSDTPLPGYDRLFVDDPFGNRIEFMQRTAPE
jgi:catechol 2,3-dioxygenase-like lactoylglutathione lyase family enzyme